MYVLYAGTLMSPYVRATSLWREVRCLSIAAEMSA